MHAVEPEEYVALVEALEQRERIQGIQDWRGESVRFEGGYEWLRAQSPLAAVVQRIYEAMQFAGTLIRRIEEHRRAVQHWLALVELRRLRRVEQIKNASWETDDDAGDVGTRSPSPEMPAIINHYVPMPARVRSARDEFRRVLNEHEQRQEEPCADGPTRTVPRELQRALGAGQTRFFRIRLPPRGPGDGARTWIKLVHRVNGYESGWSHMVAAP